MAFGVIGRGVHRISVNSLVLRVVCGSICPVWLVKGCVGPLRC